MNCTRIALCSLLAVFVMLPGSACALKKTDFIGVFTFNGGAFTNATLMFERYNIVTKNASMAAANPIPGQWRYRPGKKNVWSRWPDALLEVHALDADTLTGSYKRTHFPAFECTLTRTNVFLIDTVINAARPRSVYGMVLSSRMPQLKLADYRITLYARTGVTAQNLQPQFRRLFRFGTFYQMVPAGYTFIEAYVISNGFIPPAIITNSLAVDQTTVFSIDVRTNRFKYFDWSTTNNPAVF